MMTNRTTWRESIASVMKRNKDSVDNIVAKTVTDAELDTLIGDSDSGFNRISFIIWTHTNVYFSVIGNGNEWIGHVPRNPVDV